MTKFYQIFQRFNLLFDLEGVDKSEVCSLCAFYQFMPDNRQCAKQMLSSNKQQKLKKIDLSKSRSQKNFKIGDKIIVNDLMQKKYSYVLSEEIGKNFDPEFTPKLSPAQMLKLGVFEGKYLNDCTEEFPKEWYQEALDKLSPEKADVSKNYFKIKSRQPLSVWRKKDWIMIGDPDVRGWFQWYCRYYIGRRDPVLDQRQIKRWKSFRRHEGQIKKNCIPKDLRCRPKQRQALLQWAYDPFI